MKEYLPLGSIVVLKEGRKPIMIYGRKQIHASSNEEFDYVACLYPEGNINEDYTYVFNNSQIDRVIHIGYTNDEDKYFANDALNGVIISTNASQVVCQSTSHQTEF